MRSLSNSPVAQCRSYTIRPADLSDGAVDQMWKIFSRYYEIDDKDDFIRSLNERDFAFIIEDRANRKIVGFTSVLISNFPQYRAIYSGDTMIEPTYWGAGKHLGYQMVKLSTKLYLAKPHRPLYWFLMSQGHRTYLMMARNFIQFYPTWRRGTPHWAVDVIKHLATFRYGSAYKPDTGLIVFENPRKPLRSWVAPITEKNRADPDIAFFERINPKWDDCEELACLGVIDLRQLLHSWFKFTKALAATPVKRTSAKRERGLWFCLQNIANAW